MTVFITVSAFSAIAYSWCGNYKVEFDGQKYNVTLHDNGTWSETGGQKGEWSWHNYAEGYYIEVTIQGEVYMFKLELDYYEMTGYDAEHDIKMHAKGVTRF